MKINMNGTNGKNLRDLVGHMVCRTTPIYQNRYNGFAGFPSSEPNYKYCDLREAVKVIKVVNDVVLVERISQIKNAKTRKNNVDK